MDEIRLIEPAEAYADQIWAYRARFLESKEDDGGCGELLDCQTVEEWLAFVRAEKHPETCPEGRVPSDCYLAIRTSDNKLVGMIDLRHHIDHPVLGTWGGHIGYSVHPEERRKGYATRMLRMDLENARKLGIQRVMITCDDGNIASEKTILKNGGVYEKDVPVDGRMVKRFWIEL
ncbi:MAG: GNAT family N-acetyltransferase [Clostridia bacterium]|nr:GNAT family N-acetyltransferase [Clostridia bacterium]